MNMFNHMFINPGYAGNSGSICGTMFNRQQWMGFDGAPTTRLVSANMPFEFPKDINSGVGLNIYIDELGFENDFGFNAAYAYRLDVGPGQLGLGLSVGVLNKSLNAEWITPDFLDPNLNYGWTDDPAIPENDSHMALDLGFGAFYGADNFYVGISTTHLNQAEIKYSSLTDAIPFIKRHYYISAGYFYQLPNPLFELQPSLLIKNDGPTTQVDLNALLLYNKTFWGGLSYRFEESIVVIVGATLPMNLKFGISYDINIGDIGQYSNGTLEIMINYCFDIIKDTRHGSYRSVRY